MTDQPNRHWAVGHTPPGWEAKARDRLREHGCEVYLPTLDVPTRPPGSRCRKLIPMPLFPTYLFVDIGPFLDAPLPANGCLAGLVSWGGHLTWDHGEVGLLSDGAIDQVRAIEGEGLAEPERAPLLVLVTGERVRIVAGPFTGYDGRVANFDPERERASITLELLGRQRDVLFTDLTNVSRCA